MGFVMQRESERRVLVHAPLLEPDLLYVSVDLFPVVKIVGKGAVHLGGSKLREIAEDVFSRQPSMVVDRHRTDRKAGALNHRAPAAYTPFALDVGMSSSFLLFFHAVRPPGNVHFSPALRRASRVRSAIAGSFCGVVRLNTSREKLGLIRRIPAASARASFSRPNSL